MFKSLRTSTKLLLLCSVFVGALGVATYSLVAEKQIAIQFVRKELVDVARLEAVRDVYAAILSGDANGAAVQNAVHRLVESDQDDAKEQTSTALVGELVDAVDDLASNPGADKRQVPLVAALKAARNLASHIGDSNLALDTDLDSYYVQDIVASKMPALLTQLGEQHAELTVLSAAQPQSDTLAVRTLVLDGAIRSTLEGIERDLQASYRGRAGAKLRQALGADMKATTLVLSQYLDKVSGTLDGAGGAGVLDRAYAAAVSRAVGNWTLNLGELKHLLNDRLDDLLTRLWNSLILIGVAAALALAFALVTARHIVRPLLKLERVADEVGQTKNYKLRADYEGGDEIGRVALAFNAMLGELETAREREATDAARQAAMQAELARVARITTMGEMAASIAHEINQPLAAIVNNANASLRWLGQDAPNIGRARSVLQGIVSDGERASEVIRSVRAMLAKSSQDRVQLDVNDLIREVTTFLRADLRNHSITLCTELATDLPRTFAVRIQLEQVLINLMANAVESMAAPEHRARTLTVRSQKADGNGIVIAVEDTGAGIEPTDLERVFEAFFSTKPEGMGMGLSICRSIVEAHGGHISASLGRRGGSIFEVSLPEDAPGPLS